MHRYPRARCRSRRRTRFRTTAGPTARLTTNPTSACRSEPGSTSRLPDSSGRPALLPRLLAASKSARRRIRAAAGSMSMRWRSRPQTLTRARPFRRLAARTARPARVRMRSRKPCVFARRRLFGWNVRLLTRTPVGGRSWCSGQCAQDKRGWDASCPYSGRGREPVKPPTSCETFPPGRPRRTRAQPRTGDSMLRHQVPTAAPCVRGSYPRCTAGLSGFPNAP
jgi:hypothetical protein